MSVDIFGRSKGTTTSVDLSRYVRKDQPQTLSYYGDAANSFANNPLSSVTDMQTAISTLAGGAGRSFAPLIPHKTGNIGWIRTSASSTFNTDYDAWKAFTSDPTSSEWATQGVTENYWLQIAFSHPICIFRFILRGRNYPEDILSWKIEGSNDEVNWTTLYTALDNPQSSAFFRFYTILEPNEPSNLTNNKWYFIRLFVVSSTAGSVNPGISHMQLYGLNPLQSFYA